VSVGILPSWHSFAHLVCVSRAASAPGFGSLLRGALQPAHDRRGRLHVARVQRGARVALEPRAADALDVGRRGLRSKLT